MATLGVRNDMNLTFEHVPTGKSVTFPAYLENLADMYTSTWMAEDVYGRMDQITTFVNTRRAISVSWNVPADSFDDAKLNLQKINNLLTFLYPVYSSKAGAKGATAINQGPLMRVSFGNLIRNATGGGLLGWVNGFTMDPRVENGMFHSQGPNGMEYYPKTVLLNCEFNILHEHELGFKKEGNRYVFRNKKLEQNNFPYYTSNLLPSEDTENNFFNRTVTGGRIGELQNPLDAYKEDPGSVAAAEAAATEVLGED